MNTIQQKRKRKPFFSSKNAPQRGNTPINKKAKKEIDHSLLVKKAKPQTNEDYQSERKITDLPIDQCLIDCLVKKGFQQPTEIQDKSIDALIEGRDILGIAQTGTGKTGAFLIPIIQQLINNKKRKSYAIVIVPTRELALQVEQEFKSMTKGLGLFSESYIGGTNINKDLQSLRRNSHLIIGTPGRLLDLVQRKALDLRIINTLVLDEFDRMLDMGFVNDIKRIIHGMHQRKQSMLFSATLNKSQKELIDAILENPVTVKVSSGLHSTDNVDQDVIRINAVEDKYKVLVDLLNQETFNRVIIFDETKHQVKRLTQKLNKSGIRAEEIHGNKTQNARQNALNNFKSGKSQVLVATDVAARGIDVSDITHVINYQVPTSYDSYIHRIGRTGRAGKTGIALTFIDKNNGERKITE